MLRFVGRLCAVGLMLVAGTTQAQVVVSQVYGGGGNSGATLRSDFIELHNNGTTAVDLSTWSVQYASSTGTSWARTNLTGSIAAGGYYLVKEADGAGGTVSLPTPDATGTIAMSGTAGKVALVSNQTTLTGACPLGGAVADFVGFGSAANCSETSPSPAPSNTLAVLRAGNGCTDTDNNSSDFATGTPDPRNTASPAAVCGGGSTPLLAVNDVSALEGDSGTTTFTFGFGLSQPAGAGGVVIQYATADGTATAGSDYVAASGSVTIPQGSTSATVTVDVIGDTTTEPDETFFLNIVSATGATISDGQGLGTILNDDVSVVAIHDIQGNGLTSPLNGGVVVTEGIVTALKFNNGFFLQAPDAEADADPNTSEGIFVFTSTAPPAAAAVGNRVRVTGTISEFTPSTNLNQLSITELVSPTVIQLTTGNPLPAPVVLTTADFGPGATPGTAEKFEGMRVTVAAGRVIAPTDGNISESSANSSTTGVFHIVLDGVARPFREPGLDVLDLFPVPAGKNPPRFDHNPERIMVRSRGQIGASSLTPEVDAQIADMTGVMDYFSGTWALLPDVGSGTVTGGKTPTPVSNARYEDVTVAGFNLQRFFDEVNDSNGATTLSAAAVDKRLTKASLAICDYLKTPDILGLVEVENLRVIGLLADRINSTCPSAPVYVPYLVQGNDVGGINVGYLVNTKAVGATERVEVLEVTQYGKDTLFTNPNNSTSLLNDRPPLLLRALVHQDNGANYPITVIINHLRSLNGLDDTTAGSNGWPTEGDRVRNKRGEQAVFLANLVQSIQNADPTEHVVLLGDFNAYQFSDGYVDVMGIVRGDEVAEDQVITWLPSPITTPLIDGAEFTPDPAERYSYTFDGNAQTLDHALLNEAVVMDAADISVEHARIDADFSVLNYGIAGIPTRISDHDPVRVAISVAAFRSADLSVVASAAPATVHVGGTATYTAIVNNAGPSDAASASIALAFDALVSPTVTAPAGWTCAAPVQAGSTTTVTCTAATLASGGSATFTADVVPGAAQADTDLGMTAAVASLTTDPANANNNASASVHVIAEADLSITASAGGNVDVGGTATYTVVAANNGEDDAQFASVALVFGATVSPSVTAPAGWTCAAPVQSAGTTTVTCTTAVFANGGNATFGASVPVDASLGGQSLTLAAAVASQTTDPVAGNNQATATVDVRAIADLSATAAATAGTVPVGGTASYTANVANGGPSAAASVTLTLGFDALVAPITTAPAGWTCATPTQTAGTTSVVCTTASMVASANAAFATSFPATAALAGRTVRMTATVSSASPDTVAGNNSASATVSIAAAALDADLSVRMMGRSERAGVFLLAMHNAGPASAAAPVLTITGNLRLRNVSIVPASGWTCTSASVGTGFRFVCTASGPIAAGSDAYFGLALAGRGVRVVTVTADVTSATPDPNTANNTAVRTLIGAGLPDVCRHRYCRR